MNPCGTFDFDKFRIINTMDVNDGVSLYTFRIPDGRDTEALNNETKLCLG